MKFSFKVSYYQWVAGPMVKFCTSHSSLIASMWELLWGSGLIIITHWSQPKRRLLVHMWLFSLLMNFLSLSDLCDVKIMSTNGKTNYIEYLNNLTLQLHGPMIDGPANWPQALLTRTPLFSIVKGYYKWLSKGHQLHLDLRSETIEWPFLLIVSWVLANCLLTKPSKLTKTPKNVKGLFSCLKEHFGHLGQSMVICGCFKDKLRCFPWN